MTTPATATYFVKNNFGSTTLSSGIRTGTLADNDLIRGDDAGEAILASNGFKLFDGIDNLTFDSLGRVTFVKTPGEILASVTFSDGTSISGVKGLQDIVTGPYAQVDQFFLLDPEALAAAGKTMADVVDVTATATVDHDLDWSDFGISGTPVAPVLPPPPPPPPVLNRIEGTSGRDTLVGTSGDDLIIANGGNRDRLTGRAGEDTFVFGNTVGNGIRDIAVITDYDAFDDTILLIEGARMARFTEKGDTVTIILAGSDGDRIILENVPDSGPLFKLVSDPDFIV